jgi:hypothetical protein
MSSSIARDMVKRLSMLLASEGIDGLLIRGATADLPSDGIALRFTMRHPGVRDELIVNAYGVNAQIITLPHLAAFNDEPPEKFDALEETLRDGSTRVYVFDAVTRRHFGGVTVAWTAYCRGRGA